MITLEWQCLVNSSTVPSTSKLMIGLKPINLLPPKHVTICSYNCIYIQFHSLNFKNHMYVCIIYMHGIYAVGIATKVVDGMWKAPCETSVLFPTSGGNIHSFHALTSCAVLDVLSPPYSEDLGRPSSYFSDFSIPPLPGN